MPKTPTPKTAKKKHTEHTTVWLRRETLELLDQQAKRGETRDGVVTRILSGEGEVWVEILGVDGDIPTNHEVIFKMGDYLYRYNRGRFEPLKKGSVKVVA